MKANHTPSPRVLNADKNAAYPKAIDELETAALPKTCELQNKHLNNIVE